jgi:hypothetical protein
MSERISCPDCRRVLSLPRDCMDPWLACPQCEARIRNPQAREIAGEVKAENRSQPCPSCGGAVESGRVLCSHCQEPLQVPRQPSSWGGERVVRADSRIIESIRILLGPPGFLGGLVLIVAVVYGLVSRMDEKAQGPLFIAFGVLFGLLFLCGVIVGLRAAYTKHPRSASPSSPIGGRSGPSPSRGARGRSGPISCPGCRRALRLPRESAAPWLICPFCKARFPHPQLEEAADGAGSEHVIPDPACPIGAGRESHVPSSPPDEEPSVAPQGPPRKGGKGGTHKKRRRVEPILTGIASVLSGVGVLIALVHGSLAWRGNDPAPLVSTLILLLVLALVSTWIVLIRRRGPGDLDAEMIFLGAQCLTAFLFVGGYATAGCILLFTTAIGPLVAAAFGIPLDWLFGDKHRIHPLRRT